ncbi:HupE/UreJ family protein [Ancylobacter sp. Lp-2]|uniref:HupE/UreJ family protein n=1 Tax=Ancylobacter sp. Lp-2 TaxID=2881339 RepID=UPI001E58F402|nr:HupE/UreJ family protein [Ancylobacter sp. Lp-2]MCB4769206.1 HupE/UreJ family protein [Ancylobacter sp. Lp-2]
MSNAVSSQLRRAALTAVFALSPALAFAHPGHEGAAGLVHGFAHPIGGLDHVLAMVAVGIFAAQLGGRAIWAVPATFVALMAVGGALGMAGIGLPFVEFGILGSIVALGLVVAMGWKNAPLGVAMALVGFFAVFHGHAHGTEMPADASGLAYAAGFMLATAALHIVGVGLGLAVGKLGEVRAPRLTQALGAVVAVAGLGLLSGVI